MKLRVIGCKKSLISHCIQLAFVDVRFWCDFEKLFYSTLLFGSACVV
jgi:hypothetical protein